MLALAPKTRLYTGTRSSKIGRFLFWCILSTPVDPGEVQRQEFNTFK